MLFSSLLLAATSLCAPSPSFPAATIDFTNNGTKVYGILKSPNVITLKYATERATCGVNNTGIFDDWHVDAHYVFNHNFSQIVSKKVAYWFAGNKHRKFTEIFNPPKGDLQIWFSCTNSVKVSKNSTITEVTYDHNDGTNYHFEVL